MPNCRIELFATEPGYDPICSFGDMAHMAASSDGGPRPDLAMSQKDRDQYENLILLCKNHHYGTVDGLMEAYPIERLRQIKKDHEAWVRTALPERGFSNTQWSVVKLQGDFGFDPSTIAEALSPDQEKDQLQLTASPSRTPWVSIQDELRGRIEEKLLDQDPLSPRIAVFPLAPVSACLFSGYLLTNRVNVRAYQYHRDDATWAWPKNVRQPTSPNFLEITESLSASADVLFFFELTAPIEWSLAGSKIGGELAAYQCSVPDPSTAWLKSKTQLDELARKAREMFEQASIKYHQSGRWHIFYAGPAPGAVVVGQQLNPTMIPAVQLYEFQRPDHIPSILIRPSDSALTRWTSNGLM
jgi:SMODS-associated and fused to various effectors sensor domain